MTGGTAMAEIYERGRLFTLHFKQIASKLLIALREWRNAGGNIRTHAVRKERALAYIPLSLTFKGTVGD